MWRRGPYPWVAPPAKTPITSRSVLTVSGCVGGDGLTGAGAQRRGEATPVARQLAFLVDVEARPELLAHAALRSFHGARLQVVAHVVLSSSVVDAGPHILTALGP